MQHDISYSAITFRYWYKKKINYPTFLYIAISQKFLFFKSQMQTCISAKIIAVKIAVWRLMNFFYVPRDTLPVIKPLSLLLFARCAKFWKISSFIVLFLIYSYSFWSPWSLSKPSLCQPHQNLLQKMPLALRTNVLYCSTRLHSPPPTTSHPPLTTHPTSHRCTPTIYSRHLDFSSWCSYPWFCSDFN